ncbi:MAG: hypothetical protein Q8930_15705 [Bacillota bacterium]|nr:hypothetical protein [Bacillota bacterium]
MSGSIWDYDDVKWQDTHEDNPGERVHPQGIIPVPGENFMEDVRHLKKYIAEFLSEVAGMNENSSERLIKEIVEINENLGILNKRISNESEKDEYNICRILTIEATVNFADEIIAVYGKVPESYLETGNEVVIKALIFADSSRALGEEKWKNL